MGRLIRLVVGGVLFLTALLAGCKKPGGLQSDYGIVIPFMPPIVVLTDLTYKPAGLVRAGDHLTLLATTSQPAAEASVIVHAWPVDDEVLLKDDGQPPDDLAMDGIWMAEYVWPLDAEPTEKAYFMASFQFDDNYRLQDVTTPYFEVLPAEDDAS